MGTVQQQQQQQLDDDDVRVSMVVVVSGRANAQHVQAVHCYCVLRIETLACEYGRLVVTVVVVVVVVVSGGNDAVIIITYTKHRTLATVQRYTGRLTSRYRNALQITITVMYRPRTSTHEYRNVT